MSKYYDIFIFNIIYAFPYISLLQPSFSHGTVSLKFKTNAMSVSPKPFSKFCDLFRDVSIPLFVAATDFAVISEGA